MKKMVHCEGDFSIDIRAIPDAALNEEFRGREVLLERLKDELSSELQQNDAANYTVEVLRAALFRKGVEADAWIPEVYRMVAEGRTDDALHVMKSEIPALAPPSHECAVADLLSSGRA